MQLLYHKYIYRTVEHNLRVAKTLANCMFVNATDSGLDNRHQS